MAGISVSRPLVGLTFLVAVTPFYSILRESSAGSPVFFLWPYLLTGVLLLVITGRELTRVLEERGVARPRWFVAMATIGFIVGAIVTAEIWVGAVSLVLTDSALSSTRELLGNGPMGVATVVLTVGAALFFGLFLRAMYQREGRLLPLDLVMVAFIGWGVLQILNTYDRTGLLFTGLNGFRYYYFAAMVYFPARYLLRAEGDRKRLITVLGVVALVAGFELYGENLLLNAVAGEPSSLPWANGYLSSEFGYTPDTQRTFFEGRYIPLGFMYQTHMSGLFVALGFGLWLPLTLSARSRPMLVGAAFALLFLMINSIWTSRTVLLLVGAASLLAVAFGRAGWRRSVALLVALAVAAPVVSSFLIPGVRYDLQGDLGFLGGRALPGLARAIGMDLEQVIGWNPMPTASRVTGYVPEWRRPPDGWQVVTGFVRSDADTQLREHPTSVALFPSEGGQGVELRFTLSDPQPLAGQVVLAEAWVWAEEQEQVRVQIHDGTQGWLSDFHRGPRRGRGSWERVAVEAEVAPGLAELVVDIDARGDLPVYVDSVRLSIADAGVVLLGGRPDVTRTGVMAGLGVSATPSIFVALEASASPDTPPDGWQVVTGFVRSDADTQLREHPTSVALFPSEGGQGVELRFTLSDPQPLAGQVVLAEAWVWAEEQEQVRVQIHDGTQGWLSDFHRGPRRGRGSWERVAVEAEVAPGLAELVVDIDARGDLPVYVDSVRLSIADAGVVLLGGRPDVTRTGVMAGLGVSATPSIFVALEASASPDIPLEASASPDIPLEASASPDIPLEASASPDTPRRAASPSPSFLEPSSFVQSSFQASGRPMWVTVLLGRGAAYGDWNVVFFGDVVAAEDRFAAASYSDMKVLEFFEQFGLVGALLLLASGALGLWIAGRTSWAAVDVATRARYAGAFLVVFIGYVALAHLPSLFRLGTSTAVFAILGLVVSASTDRTDEGGAPA